MSNLFPHVVKRFITLQSQQIRYLPRWSHRQPVQVIPAEEYDEAKDIQIQKVPTGEVYDEPRDTQKQEPFIEKVKKEQKSRINWNQSRPNLDKFENENILEDFPHFNVKKSKPSKPLSISKTAKPKKETVDMLETTIDNDGNFIYTKMKNNDSRISSILVQVKSKKEKDKKDLILLEGKRLIKDALDAGCKLEYILFSRMDEVEYLKSSLPKLAVKLYKMPYREMQLWSDLTTSPGIMGNIIKFL